MVFSDAVNLSTNVVPGSTPHDGLHNAERGVLNDLGARTIYGTADSPEGVVSAPVGTMYVCTKDPNVTSTLGVTAWIKWQNGAGSTGWRVLYGDTGDRSVSSSKVTSGSLILRRINDIVSVYMNAVALPAGSGIFNIFGNDVAPANPWPTGFRPRAGARDKVFVGLTNDGVNPQMLGIIEQTELYWLNQNFGNTTRPTVGLQGSFSFRTTDAWPTVLP